MPDPTYTVEIEFESGSYTNVTTDCLRLSINRESANYERGLSMGRCTLIFDNHQKKFSPLNPTGPYYSYLNPNKKIKVTANYNTVSYALFTGFLDTFTIDPVPFGSESVNIEASDVIKNLKLQTINMPFKVNIPVGSLVTDILSYSIVPIADRHIDDFPDILSFAWFEKKEPTGAINDLLTYGNYSSYVAGDGKVHIHNRHHGIGDTVVASYNEFYGLNFSRNEEGLGNRITVSGVPHEQSADRAVVSGLQELAGIVGSGSTSFWLSFIDPLTQKNDIPVNSVVFPVPHTDYTFNSAGNGSGTDLTSFTTVTGEIFATTAIFSLTNTVGTYTFITKFNVRGYPIQEKPKVSQELEVSSSQVAYGKRSYTIVSNFIDTLLYASDYTTYLMYEHKDPVDEISFSLKNQWPDVLERELTNKIHISEPNTYLYIDGMIMNLSHDISFERGLEHVVKYEIEMREQETTWLILDNSTRGILNTNTLGF